MNIVRIKDIKKVYPDFPVSSNTLLLWRRKGINSTIFVKIGGMLFVDTDAFYKMAEEVREQS